MHASKTPTSPTTPTQAISLKHCRVSSDLFGNSSMWVTRGPLSEPSREDMPRVAHAAAPMGRRHRRLRQFLRHERLTVAMLLAERDHHTAPRGRKQARSGDGRNESHCTAEIPETPSPRAAGAQYFTLSDNETAPAAREWPSPLEDLWLQGRSLQRWCASSRWPSMCQRCRRWRMVHRSLPGNE